MTSISSEKWLKTNKEYLLAEINVIKAKLLSYQSSCADTKPSFENEQDLRTAECELESIENDLTINTRLSSLVEIFQLSPFEKNILLLGIGIELDSSVRKLITNIQGNSGLQLPTFSLALSMFSDAHWSALTPDAQLRYWQLIDVNQNQILTSSTYSANETILHYLTGVNSMDSRVSPYVNTIYTSAALVPSHQRIAEKISQYLLSTLQGGITPVIQLEGSSTEDQKSIVANVFAKYNIAVYSLPVQLLPTNFQELYEFVKLWNREIILNQYVLFIDGNELSNNDQLQINHIKYLLENISGVVIISTVYRFTELGRMVHHIEVKKPMREEQQLLWKERLGSVSETLNGEIGKLVGQFNLDSNSITYLAQMAGANNDTNGQLSFNKSDFKEKLWRTCCNYTRPNLSSLAQRIEPMAKWDDLVLPEMQKSILKEICIHVQNCRKVYDEWGFRNKSNRGLGINALFTGESGTGKSMAAEVLANALHLDLYRIDLSQVVNKYIGETEKNLKKIFDAAEDTGAILLFDEADALFGRRSEVKDSHDRYSNIEVSYLLQKMEAYHGLAILTTNMKNALDKAFLRRIRFVIQFPFPDAQMRSEIWKRIFPEQTPTKNLNFDKLAKLNVAGGNIRNIALNASFAAAHKNQSVTMHDIHNAAKNEYIKLEKNMSSSESLI